MKIIFAILFVICANAHAGDIHYDAKADRRDATLRALVWPAVDCMQQGASNMVRMGMRDRDRLAQWLAQTCALTLGRFMVSDLGYTEIEAATYIFNMGRAAVDETPGVLPVRYQ